ncbi:DUF551 domain-containing protein [Serratia nevei]|uniref:DUF551 domain-containing protein n=1 Tax=Serratia nevei TaxID=2703794 RepID=UPI00313DE0A6
MTLTTDELRQIVETDHVQCGDAAAMARELLANREAQPVITDEAIDRIVVPLSPDGLDEEKHHCEWHLYHDRERIRKELREYFAAPPAPAVPDGWIACSERLPEIGERDWRTALPVLVKCEIGVIPAYYGFTYHEGEQHFGFMESVKFGDASGSSPEQYENRLMMHVTHWMPLPAAPEGGNG